MRDLEALIAEWRRSLQPELGKDAADELEDHLREKVADFCERGIEVGRAFKLAKFELGSGEAIATEFRKVDLEMWWPMRVAIVAVCVCAALAAGFLLIRVQTSGVFDPLLVTHIFVIITGYFTALTCGAVGGAFVLQRSFMDIPPQKLERAVRQMAGLLAGTGALTGLGIILGAIWSDAVLHRYWQWDQRETGGACVLVWSILFVAMARSGKLSARAVMMLGIVGNIVVSFAWFGPFAFSNSHDPFRRAQLYGFVLAHVGLLLIGCLPERWVRLLRVSAK